MSMNAIKIQYLVRILIKTHPFKNDYVPELYAHHYYN